MNRRITTLALRAALAAAPLAASPAHAALLTYRFQAEGTGTEITGYGNQGPITRAFTGAVVSFTVPVADGATVAFGYTDLPLFLTASTGGIGFSTARATGYTGFEGSGTACFANADGTLPMAGGGATDRGCSSLTFRSAFTGGLGTSFTGVITGFEVTPGTVANSWSVATSVPEPAGWALMLAGFGVAGYALRRRAGRVTMPA